MAEQLYFSRDTRCFVQFRNTTDNTETAGDLGKGAVWEIPILDGYSFSQTTNTSEITLAEMESSAGVSRRGRRMFTDSLAPAEWSFSTYIRPFDSLGQTALGNSYDGAKGAETGSNTGVHAVEEVLWASMFGADKYTTDSSVQKFRRNVQPVSGSETDVLAPGGDNMVITIQESNRSALHSFVLWFLIDTDISNPLVYRLPEAIVNEVAIDFDVDGIATLNWTGFAKEVVDYSDNLGSAAHATNRPACSGGRKGGGNLILGDVLINTGNSRQFGLISTVGGAGSSVVTEAIDEATTSTKNFIRNRLTSVDIETVDAADKVSSTFPGSYATLVSYTTSTITATAHGFNNGDQVYIDGCTGNVTLNGTHYYVGAKTTNTFKLYDTYAKGIAGSSDQETLNATSYDASSGTLANGKYSLTLTGGSFTVGNNITYLVPEELGAINKPLEHVTGTRTATGNATCYITLNDSDTTSGSSRQFFNDLVSTNAMAKVVNKFKVTMHIGGSAATGNTTDPALKIIFPTAHIEVPTHSVEDVISLETNFTALPTDFGSADEITEIRYYPPSSY